MRPPGVDILAIDPDKADPARLAAGNPRCGEFGALDHEQRGHLVIRLDVDGHVLAKPTAMFARSARTRPQTLVAEQDRVVTFGNLDWGRGDVGWPRQAIDPVAARPCAQPAIVEQHRGEGLLS